MKSIVLFLLSLNICCKLAIAAERGIKRVQLSSPAPVETPYLSGKYRALVIGNNNYDDPEKLRETVMPEIYLRLLASQSLSRGIRMNTAAEIISISVIGRSQINWIPFALRIARPRLSSNICPSTKPISRGGNG